MIYFIAFWKEHLVAGILFDFLAKMSQSKEYLSQQTFLITPTQTDINIEVNVDLIAISSADSIIW